MAQNGFRGLRGANVFSFGFFIGLLLILYGSYEVGRHYKLLPDFSFPWFPVILLLIGLWMVLKRV